jgi:hypothetical protein
VKRFEIRRTLRIAQATPRLAQVGVVADHALDKSTSDVVVWHGGEQYRLLQREMRELVLREKLDETRNHELARMWRKSPFFGLVEPNNGLENR